MSSEGFILPAGTAVTNDGPNNRNLFRIISFSGGGARGIYQAVYLRELQKQFKGKLIDHFDLITGTSTGSIIAAAFACGIDQGQVVELFREKGPSIFQKRWFSWIRRGSHYKAEPLRKAIESVFENKTLGDCGPRILIPATTLDNFGCRLYRNFPKEPSENLDLNMRIVDALMSSCAAPTYFPPIKPPDSERTYVDGGVWANAPLLVALIFAHRVLGISFDQMRVLSIGNGRSPQGATAARLGKLCPIAPSMLKTVFGMMFETQSAGAEMMAKLLIDPKSVLSVDDVTAENIGLDDVGTANQLLPPLAQQRARQELGAVYNLLGLPVALLSGSWAAAAPASPPPPFPPAARPL
jgi:predicted acylesterase/phospholipase RssA